MKAVILTGSDRTNLHPITKHLPNAYIPLINRPLIEHTVRYLYRSGVKEVMVCLNNKAIPPVEQIETSNIKVYYHFEKYPRGTAGCLKDCEGFFDDEAFIVLDGHLFLGLDLSDLMRFHMKKGADATIVLKESDDSSRIIEDIEVTKDHLINNITIRHPSKDTRKRGNTTGIYIFNHKVIDYIESNSYFDIKEQLLPRLQNDGLSLYAYETDGYCREVDTFKDYFDVTRDILHGNVNGVPLGKEILDGIWIGEGVHLSKKANLLGPVIIGNHCKIEDHAQIIGPSVIGDNCCISKNSLVRESILWDNSTIAMGARIEYSVIGKKCTIPPEKRIQRSVIIDNDLTVGDINVMPDLEIQRINRSALSFFFSGVRYKGYNVIKKGMDITLSLLGLALLSPLFLVIGIVVKMDSKGPVFFRQIRCGEGGREFKMLKFRTMVRNAERLQHQMFHKKDVDGPGFKMTNDPRETRVGRILRNSSLDEIPQLINVLKGEMSLVGPRPLARVEMKFSQIWRDIRLKVKPGITGLWQVSGRGDAPFHDWIKYDTLYVKNQSLWLDIKILVRTLWVVLKRVGAY